MSAFDSQTINNGASGSHTTAAKADVALGTLGGFVSGTGFVPFDSGGGSFGRAFAEIYNTYTLTGPSGLTPAILLNWTLGGSFSQQTPGINLGDTRLSIILRGAEPNSAGLALSLLVGDEPTSSGFSSVSHSGTVDVSQAFFNAGQGALTVGRSFIIDASLSIDGHADSIHTGGSFIADFLGTGAFSLSSDDPRVTLSSATPQSPVPEPNALLLVGSGLVGMASFAWRRRRQRATAAGRAGDA